MGNMGTVRAANCGLHFLRSSCVVVSDRTRNFPPSCRVSPATKFVGHMLDNRGDQQLTSRGEGRGGLFANVLETKSKHRNRVFGIAKF